MTLLFLFGKMIFILVLIECACRWILSRWSSNWRGSHASGASFWREVPGVLQNAFFNWGFVLSPGAFQKQLRNRSLQHQISPRAAWFAVVWINTPTVWRTLFLFLVGSVLAILGTLTGWQSLFDQTGDPATLLLLLSSPDLGSLLLCVSLGFLSGVVGRGRGVGVLLVISLLFPFLISTPGAALLIYAEGLVALVLAKEWRMIWRCRALVGCLAVVLFWIFGGWIRQAFVVLEFDIQRPEDRLVQVLGLWGILLFFDLSLTSVLLHFGWTLDKPRAFLTDSLAD